jgi:hypothetical protein
MCLWFLQISRLTPLQQLDQVLPPSHVQSVRMAWTPLSQFVELIVAIMRFIGTVLTHGLRQALRVLFAA